MPTTIAGFDLCAGEIGLDEQELYALSNGNARGQFLEQATRKLLEFKISTSGLHMVDLPDAVALAAAVWPDYVTGSVKCCCTCCTAPGETYGQVIFYQQGRTYEAMPAIGAYNADVITKVNGGMFT